MQVGIVGLPGSGKTTLFRALTRGTVDTGGYSTRSNVGVVSVPDHRVDFMAQEYKPKKITYASIEFIDLAAGPTKVHSGMQFGAEFFSEVRQVDALVHVVRGFAGQSGEQAVPVKDIQMLQEELILADLQMVENRMERLEKQLHGVKKGATTPETIESALLQEVKAGLEDGKPVSAMDLGEQEEKALRGYQFLTLKPAIAVLNISEDMIGKSDDAVEAFRAFCEAHNIREVELCAEVEMEIAELGDDEESEFLASMGIDEPAREVLIRQCYQALGLISFITANESEVRAWTVHAGAHAIDAAETIHSDLARGFIRAEVGHFSDIEAAGGWEAAKKQGVVQVCGKEHIIEDGDVVYIRFKV